MKIGIIGVGFMGMVHYLTYQQTPGARVVALCDQSPERLAGDWTGIRGNFGPPGEQMDLSGIATFQDAEQLIASAEVEVVDICLPPAAHAEVAVRALAAGKHVLCEKPMALSEADCDTMLAAAEASGRTLLIGQVLPYFPEYAWALREVRSGQHGRLLGGEFKRVISDPQWMAGYWDAAKVGGPMLDLHIHDAHFIRLLFGEPTRVTSRGSLRNRLPEHWCSLIEFDVPGLTAQVTSGVIAQPSRPFLHGFEIRLEQATLAFEFAVTRSADGQDQPGYHTAPTLLDEHGAHLIELGDGDPMNAFAAELAHAVNVFEGRTTPDCLDARLAGDAIRLCEQQQASLRESTP
ncbi:MAG: Gfo/Idh/MocA family oxidoreductase [Planctomycetales bacterium]|nr:Gfo/Idh/MocA family oxidoreductase [Planctomycetales bacterium]